MNKFLISAVILLMLSACMGTPKVKDPLLQGSLQAQQTQSKVHWRCDGDADKRWHCRDASTADGKVLSSDELTPAPTEPISNTIASAEKQVNQPDVDPTDTTSIRLATTNSQTAAITVDNLDEIPNHHFAVQLTAAQQMKAITNYQQDHPQPQTIQLHSVVNGKHWHILLLGIYPSYEAASSAVNAMSPQPSTPPWIRPIGPLKRSITPAQ
ncbi:MAG: hypothetical protein V7459_09475 [Oceanicoccus sp.]